MFTANSLCGQLQSDLKDRQVEEMEIINFVNENGFIGWKYASVLKNTGVEESMR